MAAETLQRANATIEDLYHVEGKAELVNGEIVYLAPTGGIPDAAFIIGMVPTMRFYEGAPVFAVEVRSEGDYGPAAERDRAAKRPDYFAAGTQVVWDVDLLAEEFVVRVYCAADPDNPTGYRRGETAEAEPAVPSWTMPVDDLFG